MSQTSAGQAKASSKSSAAKAAPASTAAKAAVSKSSAHRAHGSERQKAPAASNKSAAAKTAAGTGKAAAAKASAPAPAPAAGRAAPAAASAAPTKARTPQGAAAKDKGPSLRVAGSVSAASAPHARPPASSQARGTVDVADGAAEAPRKLALAFSQGAAGAQAAASSLAAVGSEGANRAFRDDPTLDKRIIEGMLDDKEGFLDDMHDEGFSREGVIRRAAELGLSEALIRQVKGVAADLAGERPGKRPTPSSLGARTCLQCDRVFFSSGPGNRLCTRCRGGDAGLAQL